MNRVLLVFAAAAFAAAVFVRGDGPALAQDAGAPAPLGMQGGYNPLAPGAAAPAAPTAEANAEFGGLPDTEGVDLIYYMCSACHSIRLVTQQRVTRQRWEYLLHWMVEEQGMAELSADDRIVVLDYLTRHFSS